MQSKKLKLIALSFTLVMMCSVLQGAETPVILRDIVSVNQNTTAAEVWSRDFDDGNISDLIVFAIDDGLPYNEYPGNFTAEDGSLRPGGEHFNIALMNSSVAYGTWSFDVFVVDQPIDHEIVIPFILNDYSSEVWLKEAYFFQIVTGQYGNFLYPGTALDQPRLQAGKMWKTDSPVGRAVVWTDQFDTNDIWGWKNFLITREDSGQFYVYMNESLTLGFKDVQHTTCNYFGFSTRAGPALDNLVVYDDVIYDAAPPEWTPTPTNQFIVLGEDFRYDINATDFSGVDTWALNDTTNFAIDSNGVVTSTVDLVLGTYGLNVSVSDTLGFTRSAVFNVIVESSPPPLSDLIPYVMIGGGVIVVIALVVVFLKKRG